MFLFGIIFRILLFDFLLDDTCVSRIDKILSSFELTSSRLVDVPGVVVIGVVADVLYGVANGVAAVLYGVAAVLYGVGGVLYGVGGVLYGVGGVLYGVESGAEGMSYGVANGVSDSVGVTVG